jgi:hypothetical protein
METPSQSWQDIGPHHSVALWAYLDRLPCEISLRKAHSFTIANIHSPVEYPSMQLEAIVSSGRDIHNTLSLWTSSLSYLFFPVYSRSIRTVPSYCSSNQTCFWPIHTLTHTACKRPVVSTHHSIVRNTKNTTPTGRRVVARTSITPCLRLLANEPRRSATLNLLAGDRNTDMIRVWLNKLY